jgi:hypothetical protein
VSTRLARAHGEHCQGGRVAKTQNKAIVNHRLYYPQGSQDGIPKTTAKHRPEDASGEFASLHQSSRKRGKCRARFGAPNSVAPLATQLVHRLQGEVLRRPMLV